MPKDPLCPLGFHPQTRWPTRCKRCFREYKEHVPKTTDDKRDPYRTERDLRTRTPFPEDIKPTDRSRSTISRSESADAGVQSKDYSSPYSSISSEAQIRLNRMRDVSAERKAAATTDNLLTPPDAKKPVRRRTTDLSHVLESNSAKSPIGNSSEKSSSSVAPNPPERRGLNETVTVRLNKSNGFSNKSASSSATNTPRESPVPPPRAKTPSIEITEDDGPDEPVVSASLRLPSVKVSDSSDDGKKKDEPAASKPKKLKKKRLLIQGVQEVTPSSPEESDGSAESSSTDAQSADVAFIIQVKSTRKKKKEDDDETMSMTTTTDTTETTLVDAQDFNQGQGSGISLWEFEELKKETERLREKCNKLEKDKNELLSRRVANLEAPKLQSSEYLKLQQKVNLLTTTNEDLKDEKKDLEAKVRELENELNARPSTELTQRTISELRSKLNSAEAQIDQLHEEKREAIQQMKDMQEEFEELQDNFREEQSEEFATIKKELDEASKNCRLLQFKLRKVEKRADQLEAEKNELESRVDSAKNTEKVARLEQELAKLKTEHDKVLKDSVKSKGSLSPNVMKKKSPVLTKAPSGESCEPPIPADIDSSQLLRDLQSTLERESDLREQLKFAEEEVNNLRQRINRIEDENESLLIQIKKMSNKGRPDLSGNRKAQESQMNGEKLDASELKLQLEINDQESKILRRKVEELETSNNKLTKELQMAEEKVHSFEKGTSVTKSKSVDEVSLLRRKIIEKEREIERLQTELLAVASKNKGKMARAKSVEMEDKKDILEQKKLQTELQKVRTEAESQRQSLEADLSRIRTELDTERGKVTQLAEMNKNLVLQMEKFKQEMVSMKEHYESVQDDFVIKNSQLSSAKEEKENALDELNREYETIEKELRALRETFNSRQDTWIKEKLALQEKMKEYEQREKKLSSIPGDKDSIRLKRLLEEKSNELDIKLQEMSSYKDQIIYMQRENDELRRKLEDYEKVSQVQMRNMSADAPNNKLDKELKAMREKLLAEEKAHRNEIAQMKLRYEQQVALKAEEISSIQSQLSRAKRERDTFRQMVDSAQRAISELKSRDNLNTPRRDSTSSGLEEAATGARAAAMALQDRVASLEDELSEARREASRAHTELATEKSTWEMKLGELQQKINELEEDRLLTGRNRAAGQRTRLELAWQKEREEQQRRLKEATTLARDLKTTLLEFERERDRERMENKRRVDQLKATMEEDQEELRRKVGETQNDLLELRDAHAKLRTANEKLRRDRERLEKERDVQLRREIEIRNVNSERERLVDELMNKIMNTQGSTSTAADTIRNLQAIKVMKVPEEPTNYKDRKKSNFRRAASAGDQDERQSQESLKSSVSDYRQEHYGRAMRNAANSSSTLTLPSRGRTPTPTTKNLRVEVNSPYDPRGSLYRKSLSLEQTVAMPDEQKIWKGEAETGSASSITSMEGYNSRGSSVDSRLSTVSTRSEKPKSSSLVKKVKKLVKSRSTEEPPSAPSASVKISSVSSVGSNVGSNSSLNYESDRDKDSSGKKLKDKVKGIFKRSSRSPSVERTNKLSAPQPPPRSRETTPKKDIPPASTQRPLMPSEQRPLMPSKR